MKTRLQATKEALEERKGAPNAGDLRGHSLFKAEEKEKLKVISDKPQSNDLPRQLERTVRGNNKAELQAVTGVKYRY